MFKNMQDPAKNEFSEEMMVYAVTFGGATISYLKGGPEADMGMVSTHHFSKLCGASGCRNIGSTIE